MRPVRLRLCGFGSFTTEQTFEFPEKPGLYFMTGRNEAEPRLEANGAGKSTIWKAITWVIYGKDPRGLKAGDVANWANPKGAWVEFDFENTEGGAWMAYTVRRTHSPNSWTLSNIFDGPLCDDPATTTDLTKDTTNELMGMLRLAFEPWLHCVVLAQNEPMFLDLKADAKAAVFAEVMGLDRWLDYAAVASKKAAAQEALTRAEERIVDQLEGQLRGATSGDLQDKIVEWQKAHDRRLRDIEDEYERKLLKLKDLKPEVERLAALVEPAREEQQRLLRILETYEAELDKAHETWQLEERALAVNDAEVARLKHLEPGSCPTCGHPIDGEDLRRRQVTAGFLAKNSFGRAKGAQERVRVAEQRAQAAKETARRGAETLDGYVRAAAAARIDLAVLDQDLDRIEAEGDRITAERNPYEELRRRALEDQRRIAADLGEARGRADESAARATRLGFWVRGFKDLRLQQIGEALTELAIEVNSSVHALGLVGWELIFEVDRETKSGSIQRGFNVFVRSPHNERAVPWDAWSGGEAQRLRLAGQMGLANLIRSRTGASIALEVWDEPTGGLSPRGTTDLLDALATRARVEQRQIWVVDHHTLGYGGFDEVVTIVKDEKGSRVQ